MDTVEVAKREHRPVPARRSRIVRKINDFH